MMWLKWLPWKYVVRKLAHSHGFADPISILSYIRRFEQPSEVSEPIELLRAGVVFHARGLINSRVIQHNLDWVWPYWVNRQFKPQSEAFIPRATSITHINLNARNWTAVGLPGFEVFPVVDPRGSVMPFWDSWSIDAWVVTEKGELLAPSRMEENVKQELCIEKNLGVVTTSVTEEIYLRNKVEVNSINNINLCDINLLARIKSPGWLVVSVRPYNAEGVSFIHRVEFNESKSWWRINEKHYVYLSERPDKHIFSDYRKGDVSLHLLSRQKDKHETACTCKVGMVTAAGMYKLEPEKEREVEIAIPLNHNDINNSHVYFSKEKSDNGWNKALGDYCRIKLPQERYEFLYEAAIKSIVLHSPDEIYPGPFTYKRFWFRDAVFIINAMFCSGMVDRAEKHIDNFFSKQTALGYFHSQEGEWDSNGQVLWIIDRYYRITGNKPKDTWIRPIIKAAKWICHKRLSEKSRTPHAGLLPAGFSAEHLGPNDYYYWDDFWSVAGLQAAARMLEGTKDAEKFEYESQRLVSAIDESLRSCRERLGRAAMPVSPYRRLDSAAVGSLAASYPVEIFSVNDERVRDTVDFLITNCIVGGGFFHDISHSGINPYLTLHLAEVMMRSGDTRFIDLVKSVARLASSTGQWPEAINPRTGSGCMGDGQHIWASAEWILMMINSFVTEQRNQLVIGAGIFPEWMEKDNEISAGPIMTAWGPVNIRIKGDRKKAQVSWEGRWLSEKPVIEIRIPNFKHVIIKSDKTSIELERI